MADLTLDEVLARFGRLAQTPIAHGLGREPDSGIKTAWDSPTAPTEVGIQVGNAAYEALKHVLNEGVQLKEEHYLKDRKLAGDRRSPRPKAHKR